MNSLQALYRLRGLDLIRTAWTEQLRFLQAQREVVRDAVHITAMHLCISILPLFDSGRRGGGKEKKKGDQKLWKFCKKQS